MIKPFTITRKQVMEAYEKVKANKGSAGIDKVSLAEFAKDESKLLYKLRNQMSSGSYMPPAVKLVEIPKKDGGKRPLRIYKEREVTFICFLRAMSKQAKQSVNATIRSWKLQKWTESTLRMITDTINPVVRGWINYYGKFYPNELRDFFDILNMKLALWARRKFKRFRRVRTAPIRWLKDISERDTTLFAHWKMMDATP